MCAGETLTSWAMGVGGGGGEGGGVCVTTYIGQTVPSVRRAGFPLTELERVI